MAQQIKRTPIAIFNFDKTGVCYLPGHEYRLSLRDHSMRGRLDLDKCILLIDRDTRSTSFGNDCSEILATIENERQYSAPSQSFLRLYAGNDEVYQGELVTAEYGPSELVHMQLTIPRNKNLFCQAGLFWQAVDEAEREQQAQAADGRSFIQEFPTASPAPYDDNVEPRPLDEWDDLLSMIDYDNTFASDRGRSWGDREA